MNVPLIKVTFQTVVWVDFDNIIISNENAILVRVKCHGDIQAYDWTGCLSKYTVIVKTNVVPDRPTSSEQGEVVRLQGVRHHVDLGGLQVVVSQSQLPSLPHHTQIHLGKSTDKWFSSKPVQACHIHVILSTICPLPIFITFST